MVIADAIQFDVLTVDREALVGVKLNGADPERGFVDIDDLTILRDGGDGHITIGRFRAPEFRLGEDEAFAVHHCPAASGNLRLIVAVRGDGPAVGLAVAIGDKDLS